MVVVCGLVGQAEQVIIEEAACLHVTIQLQAASVFDKLAVNKLPSLRRTGCTSLRRIIHANQYFVVVIHKVRIARIEGHAAILVSRVNRTFGGVAGQLQIVGRPVRRTAHYHILYGRFVSQTSVSAISVIVTTGCKCTCAQRHTE